MLVWGKSENLSAMGTADRRTANTRVGNGCRRFVQRAVELFKQNECRAPGSRSSRYTSAVRTREKFSSTTYWLRCRTKYNFEANPGIKERTLSRIEEMPIAPLRYWVDDELSRFLETYCEVIMRHQPPDSASRRKRVTQSVLRRQDDKTSSPSSVGVVGEIMAGFFAQADW